MSRCSVGGGHLLFVNFVRFAHEFNTVFTADFFDMLDGAVEIEFVALAFDDLESAGRAGTDAVAKTIAVGFLNEFRFAVNQLQSAFGATGNAVAAAIAEFFVDRDDFADRHGILLLGFLDFLHYYYVRNDPFKL